MDKEDGAPAPVDPMTALAEGSAQLHELYDSYVRAGFSPGHAIYLVGQILQAAITQQPGG